MHLPPFQTQQLGARSEAKKSQSLQDVLSKRVVQLEAKLTQQSLEKDTMAEVGWLTPLQFILVGQKLDAPLSHRIST